MQSTRPPKPPLPDYRRALDLALASVHASEEVEHVPLHEAVGRILGGAIHADRDYPPFNRATMDGYAVRAAEVGRIETFPVVGMVAAGSSEQPAVAPGQAVRIATGAPLPPDVDAVIPHESSDRGEPVQFTLRAVSHGHNIHRKGQDATAGALLLPPGTRLGGQHLGILATVGCIRVPVRTRPRIAVLTSGDEVLPPDSPTVHDHQIRNAGSSMLPVMIEAMGGCVGSVSHVPDDPDTTAAAVRNALAEHDLLITIGGISAGERDCFHAAYASNGVEPVLRGAAIQPGKPVFVGRAAREHRNKSVIGLPGNPVSVLATAHLFLWPMIVRLTGNTGGLPWTPVQLARAAEPNARREAFRPSRWHRSTNAVEVIEWAGSGDLIHTASAQGLLALPIQDQPVEPGTTLPFLPWCWES